MKPCNDLGKEYFCKPGRVKIPEKGYEIFLAQKNEATINSEQQYKGKTVNG